MTDLTPNTTPKGEQCGTCRFAGTHTHAADRNVAVLVRCRRFPPVRLGSVPRDAQLQLQAEDTRWPVLTWDDWCGEWEARDPSDDELPGPIGFRP